MKPRPRIGKSKPAVHGRMAGVAERDRRPRVGIVLTMKTNVCETVAHCTDFRPGERPRVEREAMELPHPEPTLAPEPVVRAEQWPYPFGKRVVRSRWRGRRYPERLQ